MRRWSYTVQHRSTSEGESDRGQVILRKGNLFVAECVYNIRYSVRIFCFITRFTGVDNRRQLNLKARRRPHNTRLTNETRTLSVPRRPHGRTQQPLNLLFFKSL